MARRGPIRADGRCGGAHAQRDLRFPCLPDGLFERERHVILNSFGIYLGREKLNILVGMELDLAIVYYAY